MTMSAVTLESAFLELFGLDGSYEPIDVNLPVPIAALKQQSNPARTVGELLANLAALLSSPTYKRRELFEIQKNILEIATKRWWNDPAEWKSRQLSSRVNDITSDLREAVIDLRAEKIRQRKLNRSNARRLNRFADAIEAACKVADSWDPALEICERTVVITVRGIPTDVNTAIEKVQAAILPIVHAQQLELAGEHGWTTDESTLQAPDGNDALIDIVPSAINSNTHTKAHEPAAV